jgi:hypothetical protein
MRQVPFPLQMLVEKMAKAVRRGCADAEKDAAEAAAERAAAGSAQGDTLVPQPYNVASPDLEIRSLINAACPG